MNREEWIKTLKPGDKVANKYSNFFMKDHRYEYYEIKNITKGGKIRLTNDILLDENGKYQKYNKHSSKVINIEPITADILAYETYRNEYSKVKLEVHELCEKFGRSDFTLEQLKELKDLLSKGFKSE